MNIVKTLFPVTYYTKKKLTTAQQELLDKLYGNHSGQDIVLFEYRFKSRGRSYLIDLLVEQLVTLSLCIITIIIIILIIT